MGGAGGGGEEGGRGVNWYLKQGWKAAPFLTAINILHTVFLAFPWVLMRKIRLTIKIFCFTD